MGARLIQRVSEVGNSEAPTNPVMHYTTCYSKQQHRQSTQVVTRMQEGKPAPGDEGSTALREDGDTIERGASNMYSDDVLPPNLHGQDWGPEVRSPLTPKCVCLHALLAAI